MSMGYFIPISTFDFAHNTWALPTLDLFGPANIFPSQLWEIVRYEPNFIQPQYHHSHFFWFCFFLFLHNFVILYSCSITLTWTLTEQLVRMILSGYARLMKSYMIGRRELSMMTNWFSNHIHICKLEVQQHLRNWNGSCFEHILKKICYHFCKWSCFG